MLEVKLTLEHEGEVHLLEQFVSFLRTARADWESRGGFDAPANEVRQPGAETATASEAAPTEAEAVAAITAEPGKGITNEDLETNLLAYAKKHGTPAAVELLASFGIKRLTDLKAEDRTRFYMKSSL